MAVNSRTLRTVPPPVSDDVKDAAAREAETAAAGVHAAGQDADMQSSSTPQEPAPEGKGEKQPNKGQKDAAANAT